MWVGPSLQTLSRTAIDVRTFGVILLFVVALVATLWAYETGGSVSLSGQGWTLNLSLWAFVTSLFSGAGLLWLALAFTLWFIKSPLRVWSWIRRKGGKKDRTEAFLLDLLFLDLKMPDAIKGREKYKNPILDAYRSFRLALVKKNWQEAESNLMILKTHAPMLEKVARSLMMAKQGDLAMALHYGLMAYKDGGPVAFETLVYWAQKCQRLEMLEPYMMAAYERSPSWFLFKVMGRQWKEKKGERSYLKHLKKWLKDLQTMEVFREVCEGCAMKDPMEKYQAFKELLGDGVVNLEGYRTLILLAQQAGLEGEARSWQEKKEKEFSTDLLK